MWPEGEGEQKPSYTTRWERFAATAYPGEAVYDYYFSELEVGVFKTILPDGRVIRTTFHGDVRGYDGKAGLIRREEFYAADGTTLIKAVDHEHHWQELRRMIDFGPYSPDTYEAVFPQTKKVDTTYTDADDACAGPLGAEADMTLTTELFDVDDDDDEWNNFRSMVVTGDYFRDGQKRLYYTHYFRPGSAPQCLEDNHLAQLHEYRVVEDTALGERLERRFTWNCDGTMATQRSGATYGSASTTTWTPNPVVAAPGNLDAAADILTKSTHDGLGNLTSLDYHRGDSPTTPEYGADFTYDYGRAVTLEVGGLGYYAQQIAVDPTTGAPTSAFDPNGIETHFSYDALGRLETIEPEQTEEYVTRIDYPDVHTMNVSQASGTAEDFDSGDDEQVFSRQVYDGLGRLSEAYRALPDGTLSIQVRRYDQFGRVIFVSEWINETTYANASFETWTAPAEDYSVSVPLNATTGEPWGTQTFYGDGGTNPLTATPDALGRVRRVVPTDQAEIETDYCGLHNQVTRDYAGTSGTQSATTYNYYDGRGQLVIVDTPAGGADAVYEYNLRGELTRVLLFDDDDLPTEPFAAWRAGNFDSPTFSCQERTFEYDAVGRLLSSTQPENGTTDVLEYDVWGNAKAYQDELASQRGYFIKKSYDVAGRVVQVQRIRGTLESPVLTASDRLDGAGTFDGSLTGWSEGTIDGGWEDFTAGGTVWQGGSYTSLGCVDSPPDTSGTHALALGSSCEYSSAPAGIVAVRIQADDVTRDDALSLAFWRQVRTGGGDLDRLSVFVTLVSDGDAVDARRNLLQLDESQASHQRWRRMHPLRPGDLFSAGEWPEGEERDLYLYIAFEKGDSASTSGAGVFLDDVFLGYRGPETIAEYVYDIDACDDPDNSELCQEGVIDNAYLGQVSESVAYQGGLEVGHRFYAYEGLNGRPSGSRDLIDWAGVGEPGEWVRRSLYEGHGLVSTIVAPYVPGIDEARRYDYHYNRGLIEGLVEDPGGSDPSLTLLPFGSSPGIAYTPAGMVATIAFANGASTSIDYDPMARPSRYVVRSAAATTLWDSGTYGFDGSGNITGIGDQAYRYDASQRLVSADVLPQAGDSGETEAYEVGYQYDIFGNMTARSWAGQKTDPDLEIFSYSHTDNKINSSSFAYDPNGNTARFFADGLDQSAFWNEQQRMTAFMLGHPEGWTEPTTAPAIDERYGYDADGYRLFRIPDRDNGIPVISLRDEAGQLLAEYTDDPTAGGLVRSKDFIYGAGQLLIERKVEQFLADGGLELISPAWGSQVSGGTMTHTASTVHSGNKAIEMYRTKSNGGLELSQFKSGMEPGGSYLLEFYAKASTTIQGGVSASLWRLGPGGTKFLGSDGTWRSTPAQAIEADVGTQWQRYALMFEFDEAFASSDWGWLILAHDAGNPTGTRIYYDDVSLIRLETFAHHHRDHLGSLRIVTSAAGAKLHAHDYYPFGTELAAGRAISDPSRALFTGHERDDLSGLDYMMARYASSSAGRFLAVDSSSGSTSLQSPQTWNRYTYVYNNPTRLVDPLGNVPFSTLQKDNPQVAARIAAAEATVVSALQNALGDTSFDPGITIDGRINYHPKSTSFVPPGVGVPMMQAFSSTAPMVGLNHFPGQRVGLSDNLENPANDGKLADGVLRGVLFVAGYVRANGGMEGLAAALYHLVQQQGALGITHQELAELATRFAGVADSISALDPTEQRRRQEAWRALVADTFQDYSIEDYFEGERKALFGRSGNNAQY